MSPLDPIKISLCMRFSSYFPKLLSLFIITLKFFLNSWFHWLSVVVSSTLQVGFSTTLSWTCCFPLSSAVLCILDGEAHLVTALYLLQSLSSHPYLCSISCLLLTAFSRALMALWWEPVLSAGLIMLIENSLMAGYFSQKQAWNSLTIIHLDNWGLNSSSALWVF